MQRIDLQEDVAARVYESMKQTFEGIARTQRGEGDRQSQTIRADAERQRTEIIAKADADAQQHPRRRRSDRRGASTRPPTIAIPSSTRSIEACRRTATRSAARVT